MYERLLSMFVERHGAQYPKLLTYLKREWFYCAELWVKCYRQCYHGGLDTNNYMESMNRVFKHKWLNVRGDTRLDSLLNVYCDEILVYYDTEYVRANVSSLRDHMKTAATPPPSWCVNRPKNVVDELLVRMARAQAMIMEMKKAEVGSCVPSA
jgi:hypothetical protein